MIILFPIVFPAINPLRNSEISLIDQVLLSTGDDSYSNIVSKAIKYGKLDAELWGM